MTDIKVEDVDCGYYMEVEVATTDSCLFEPLKDHNYLASIKQSETIKQGIKLRAPTKTIKKNPKITSLSLLYNCSICGYTTIKHDVFVKHQEIHNKIAPGTKYIPCSSCNVNKDLPKGYHKCPYCSFYTKNKASLRVHMHIHNNGTAFKCTECAFFGKDIQDLIAHLKSSKTFVCGSCPFTSHVRNKFLKHQKKHTGKKNTQKNVINRIKL